jgi:hypothetical protein
MTDFILTNHYSIFLLTPLSPEAKSLPWPDETLWFGPSIAVEPRYAEDLFYKLEEDGFTVELQ